MAAKTRRANRRSRLYSMRNWTRLSPTLRNPLTRAFWEYEGRNYYSASQIAAATGRSKQAVLKALKNIAPAGCKVVNGKEAGGYAISQLPEGYRANLLHVVAAKGYRNTDHLLKDAPERRMPCGRNGNAHSRPCEISEKSFSEAAKLKRALQPSMERLAGCLSLASIEPQGLTITAKNSGTL